MNDKKNEHKHKWRMMMVGDPLVDREPSRAFGFICATCGGQISLDELFDLLERTRADERATEAVNG